MGPAVTGSLWCVLCSRTGDSAKKGPVMTRLLARLAEYACRHRGRMVLVWIVSAILIIGVGSSLAGEYEADYDTPGSDSEAAGNLAEERFDGYSGQEIYAVWKDEAGGP